MSRVLFGGKALREPTAAAQLRIGVQPAVNPNATNRVAILGPADGGVPQQLYTFNSFAEASAVLRGGDGLKACYHAFNPSPNFRGAAQIDFVRIDSGTSATRSFADATPVTPRTAFTVTSVDKGIWTNGIIVQVTASSTDRIVTLKTPGAAFQRGTDGVATVSGSVFEAPSAKFITKGAKAGDAIIVTANNYAAVTVYTIATIVSETRVTVSETVTAGSGLAWQHVAYVREQVSPALSAVGGSNNVNANIVAWINENAGDVVTAALGAADATLVAATTGNTTLTGGTVTAPTNTDITNALVVIRPRQVSHINVALACGTEAGELNFAGLLTGHLNSVDCEIPALGYIGAKADKAVPAAITFAGALNSARLVYTFQTAYDASLDGLETEEVPGYLLAAKVAGLAAGVEPQLPLTRKPLTVFGLKPLPAGRILDKATRESLLAAGILHIFQPVGTNTFVINQAVTTLQKNDSLWDANSASSPEISLMRIVDAVLTDLRLSAAETFIGSTATMAKPVVEHFVASYLQSRVGDLLQSYSGVTVTQNQDKWFIQFGMVPNYPINFVLITGTIVG